MSGSYTTTSGAENKVLFTIPFTKETEAQLTIALTLHCRSSIRGIQSLFADVFGYKTSLGNLHNTIKDAAIKAKELNDREDLAAVRVGAHDEIFQSRTPVLVGIDPLTYFTYLLSIQEKRDSTTWGSCLIDLKERGFDPNQIVADSAKGLRAGQKEVFPNTSCRSDVFHALQDITRVINYMENKAYGAIKEHDDLKAQMAKAKLKHDGHKLSKKIACARSNEEKRLLIADTLIIIGEWMKKDILSLTGPSYQERSELFDFVLTELEKLEKCDPGGKIKKLRKKLLNEKHKLLEFVSILDEKMKMLANEFDSYDSIIREVFNLRGISPNNQYRWEKEARLKGILGYKYYSIEQELVKLARETVRASSAVENLNSRLRSFFHLRKDFKQGSLDLLQFYFNHKPFLRSKYPERVGKSPKELLTQYSHPHWLEMLGFQPFKRAVA